MVRCELPPTEAGPGARFTDVLGLLMAWDDDVIVSRADCATVRIPRHSVVAAKVVPPPPVGAGMAAAHLTDRELDAVMMMGWRGSEAEWHNGWLLRAGGGFTGRANSTLALRDPGPPIELVERWYEHRGLPPKMQVSLPLRADLDEELAALGWRAFDPTLVMTASVSSFAADTASLRIDTEVDDAWLGCYHYRGGQLPAVGRLLISAAERPGFASIRGPDGEVRAIARGAVDQGWVGLAAIEVADAHRRQGLGTTLVTGLGSWAAGVGAHSAYLQVAETNLGAIAMYENLGFTVHHRYHYRTPDAG